MDLCLKKRFKEVAGEFWIAYLEVKGFYNKQVQLDESGVVLEQYRPQVLRHGLKHHLDHCFR